MHLFVRSMRPWLLLGLSILWISPALAAAQDQPFGSFGAKNNEQPEATANTEAADPSSAENTAEAKAPSSLAAQPTETPANTSEQAAPVTPPDAAFDSSDIKPIQFNGVQLGTSTVEDVIAAWGEPLEVRSKNGTVLHHYVIKPFEKVELTVDDDKVQSMTIALAEPFGVDEVAAKLGIANLQPVAVPDEFGKPLGVAFPERGVVLVFAPGQPRQQVSQIMLALIDPQPFVLRAKTRLADDFSGCLEDLATALQLDADYAQALWLRARLLSKLGRSTDALSAIQNACQQEPANAQYLLTRSELLAQNGQYDRAMADTQRAATLATSMPQVKALALCLLGDQLAAGPRRDYKQAIDYHLRAIKIAESLLNERLIDVRRQAYQTLIDAHLAVAQDVAWGRWQQKETVALKWLQRAQTLVERGIESGDLDEDYKLKVYRQALAAHVGLDGKVDPEPWAEALLEFGRERVGQTRDPLRQRQLEWELGLGLYDALQTYHQRSQPAPALEYGGLAVNYLERGIVARQESPGDAYLLGRLYFRIGSVYAIHQQTHAQAVVWFDKAAPLLERPIPNSALADPGRQGETLVSMAVSYWAVGGRQRAISLTQRGAQLMEEAVEQGILDRNALNVPYSNMATMHRHLGDAAKANSFAEMAEKVGTDSMR